MVKYEKTGTFYIGYIECPKCSKNGQLTALVSRYNKKWYGPYFLVSHRKSKYDSSIAKQLKLEGLRSYQVYQSGKKTKNVYVTSCYLGSLPPDLAQRFSEKLAKVTQYIDTEDEDIKEIGKHGDIVVRIKEKCPICQRPMFLLPSQKHVIFCSRTCEGKARQHLSGRIKHFSKQEGVYECFPKMKTRKKRTVQKYVCSVRCSRCGKKGAVIVQFTISGTKWFGPYFMVRHRQWKYSPEDYRKAREEGKSENEARHIASYQISLGACHFGKTMPEGSENKRELLSHFDPEIEWQRKQARQLHVT